MPELPEVETVKQGLIPVLQGRRLTRVIMRRPDLRIPLPKDFVAKLENRTILSIERRAKYLVLTIEGGTVLLIHLGMSGRMIVSPYLKNSPPGPHDHIEFQTEEGASVTFCDPRRFGLMTLCPLEELESHPLLAKLGPEPLSADFTPHILARNLHNKKSAIKIALLDQTIVAGIGNIYACEALFHAGISPLRQACDVAQDKAACRRLTVAIKDVLAQAIAVGGSSLRDHRQPSGELGYFQNHFAVYDHEGKACPDCTCRKDGILRIVQGGRSTFYCATRQKP